MFETMSQTFGTAWAYYIAFTVLIAWWAISKLLNNRRK